MGMPFSESIGIGNGAKYVDCHRIVCEGGDVMRLERPREINGQIDFGSGTKRRGISGLDSGNCRFAFWDGIKIDAHYCPRCGVDAIYTYKRRPIFKCIVCEKQFSLTSGTIFASRKMPMKKILFATPQVIDAAKGVSALELSRKLQCQYKTAWVLEHKLREAMVRDFNLAPLCGTVEVDGTWVGGYTKPKNARKEKDVSNPETLKKNPWAIPYLGKKKLCVVVVRERGGRVRTFVGKSEIEAKDFIRAIVSKDATLHCDQYAGYDDLIWHFKVVFRINHSECFFTPESNTNSAENYFSMLKRAIKGVYHHIAHPNYVHAYTEEMGWRLTNMRIPNLEKFTALVRATALPSNSKFVGVWQRRAVPGRVLH
jgi:hypothetical protein